MSAEDSSEPPPGVPTGAHLCPILAFHSVERNSTLFNLVPLAAAMNAERLLVLTSVPFYSHRFYGVEFQEKGVTYPLDIWYLTDSAPLKEGPRVAARPVVVWSDQPDLPELLANLLDLGALCILIVSDLQTPSKEIADFVESKKLVSWISVYGGAERRFHPESPILIWTAFLKLIQVVSKLAGADERGDGGNRMAPELKTPVSLARQILAAQRGSCAPWTEKLHPAIVPWDFVAAPNVILINHMSCKLCVWGDNVFEPADAHAIALRYAKRLLAARGLSNYLMYAARASGGKDDAVIQSFQNKIVPRAFRPLLAAATRDGLNEAEKIEKYSELFEKVPDKLSMLAPHQIILICPSATLAMDRAKASFDRRGLVMMDHGLEEKDPAYFETIQKAASAPGRIMQIPKPETEIQEAIAMSIYRGVTLESQYLSALGVAYATRFNCPVLKLTRSGSEVFEPFLAVHDEFRKQEPNQHQLQESIDALSVHTAALFPQDYLSFVTSRPDCILHSFADFPLEFAKAGHDYLGFRTQLSRTPITPGDVPLINYNFTEYTTPMPSRLEECILVTPFADGDKELEAIKANFDSTGTSITPIVIRRKEQLCAQLSDKNVRCLIYIGHGYHNSKLDENALQLPDGLFSEQDLRDISRVPPLVILIGCTTAPSVSVFSGMHTAFLRRGAAVVVGTSFDVPTYLGISFLTTLVAHLIGAKHPIPRDVSDLVRIVRHEIRPLSVLVSMIELERIDWNDLDEILAEHRSIVDMLPASRFRDNYHASFRAFAKILARRKLIPNEGTPPIEWGVVPYSLFFSTFGFPWTSRNRQWEKGP